MTDLPVLYSFRRCPYAMRARLALMVSGTTCTIREVKLSNKPEALLEASAKATVPVLVTTSGEVVDESISIMRLALARNDPEGWLERQDHDLIEANDGPFKHHLDRYKYSNRHDCDPLPHRAAAMEMLRALETRLEQQAHLSGEKRGLTDMAIMPFIRQFAATDREWFVSQNLPQLHTWLADHTGSPLFQSIMPRLAPWAEGDPEITFA